MAGKEIVVLRRDCRHYLRYGQRNFCRQVWTTDIRAAPRELSFGCDTPERCADYSPAEWKREQLSVSEREALETDKKPAVLEWEEED